MEEEKYFKNFNSEGKKVNIQNNPDLTIEEMQRKIEEVMQKLYIEEVMSLKENEKITEISYFKDMSVIPQEILGFDYTEDTYVIKKQIQGKNGKNVIEYELFKEFEEQLEKIGEVKAGKLRLDGNYLKKLEQAFDNLPQLQKRLEEFGKNSIDFEKMLEENKNKIMLYNSSEKIEENIEKNPELKEDMRKKQMQKELEESNEQSEDKVETNDPEVEKKIEQTKRQLKERQGTQCLFIRENSNFYKDHDSIRQDEPNLFLVRGQDGVVRAKYIDKKTGEIKSSNYIEDSKTEIRKVISLCKDGTKVEKNIPYQTMSTKGLTNNNSNIHDIKIAVNFGQYGYMDIEEARQGKSGEEYLSHDIETIGRDYNSETVREETSNITKTSDPTKTIEAYEQLEHSGVSEDGLQLQELETEEKMEERFVNEGYQEKEAKQIYSYITGEEKLNEKEAKEKVNKEIEEEKEKQVVETKEENQSRKTTKETEKEIEADIEERTLEDSVKKYLYD